MASTSDDKDRYIPVVLRNARDLGCDLIVAKILAENITNGQITAKYPTWRDVHRRWLMEGRYSAFSLATVVAIAEAIGLRFLCEFVDGRPGKFYPQDSIKPATGGRRAKPVHAEAA